MMKANAESEAISLSTLRADLFRLADKVIETGEPVEIDRNGHRLKLVLGSARKGRLAHFRGHPDNVLVDSSELDSMSGLPEDWLEEWSKKEDEFHEGSGP